MAETTAEQIMGDKYLPIELRDIKFQKKVFSKMYEFYSSYIKGLPSSVDENLKFLDELDICNLATDFILWHLARQGYLLVKNDKYKVDRYCIKED